MLVVYAHNARRKWGEIASDPYPFILIGGLYILFKFLRPIPHTCRISINCAWSQPIETADKGIAY